MKCTTDLLAQGPSATHHWRLKECSEEVLQHSCPVLMLFLLSATLGDTGLEAPQTWLSRVFLVFLWLSVAS